MNDLALLKEMFDRAGIVYTVEEYVTVIHVNVTAYEGPKNTGYAGFSSNFTFTKDGQLKEVGAYE